MISLPVYLNMKIVNSSSCKSRSITQQQSGEGPAWGGETQLDRTDSVPGAGQDCHQIPPHQAPLYAFFVISL